MRRRRRPQPRGSGPRPQRSQGIRQSLRPTAKIIFATLDVYRVVKHFRLGSRGCRQAPNEKGRQLYESRNTGSPNTAQEAHARCAHLTRVDEEHWGFMVDDKVRGLPAAQAGGGPCWQPCFAALASLHEDMKGFRARGSHKTLTFNPYCGDMHPSNTVVIAVPTRSYMFYRKRR